jgi:hypothetical protein
MTRLEFNNFFCIFYLVDHVRAVHVLDLNDVALHLQRMINNRCQITRRCIGGCFNRVCLVDWESARLTWVLAGTTAAWAVGLVDWEVDLADSRQATEAVDQADLEQVTEVVGLADSEHVAIGSTDLKVSSADSELEGSSPLLLIGV